jgi:hypothetical protein
VLSTFAQQSICSEFGKHLRHSELELLICLCRDGRVVNARALRARGPSGPHGFESHSRRLKAPPYFQDFSYKPQVTEGLNYGSTEF